MKQITTLILVLISLFSSAQIIVQNTQTPVQLVQNVLLGSGVTATNIKYNGSLINANNIQTNVTYFNSNNTNFPINKGVLLTTGNGNIAVGPNNQTGATNSTGTNPINDNDLNSIAANTVENGAILEFDFTAVGDTVNFKYLFASEEYPDDYEMSFYDVFGFFLSGPGITGTYSNNGINLALLPGTNTPISILNLNPTINNQYYVNNANGLTYGTAIEYDGTSIILTSSASLICGQTYHIKLCIANVGDEQFDSGVFLEANSFSSSSVNFEASSNIVGSSYADSVLAEGCSSSILTFTRPTSSIDSLEVFHIQTNGTIDVNNDFTSFIDSVVFNIGVDTVTYILNPVDDGINEPLEWLEIKGYSVNICGDTIYDSLTIYILDKYQLIWELPDTIYANCSTINPSVLVSNLDHSVPNYNFSWSNSSTTNPNIFINTGNNLDTSEIFVEITDGCGTLYNDSVLIINDYEIPEFDINPDTIYNSCNLNVLSSTVLPTISNFSPYTYLWSNNIATATANNLMNSGIDGSKVVYYVTTTNACGMSTQDSLTIINDFEIPEFTILPNDTLINNCVTNQLSAQASLITGTAPPYTFLWSNNITTATNNNLTNNGPNGSHLMYYVTTTNLCGVSTIDSVLIINQFIVPSPSFSPNDTLFVPCLLDSTLANVNVTGGILPYTYTWNDGSTNNNNYIVDTIGVNGQIYHFNVTVTDACNLDSTISGIMIVNKIINTNLTSTPASSCIQDGSANSNTIGTSGQITYQWIGPGKINGDTLTTQNISNVPSGWYYFTVTDNVCFDTDSIKIDQLISPQAVINSLNQIATAPSNITFFNNSSNSTNYFWDFGNGETITSNDLSVQNSNYQYSGDYIVTLIAYNGPCSDTAILNIQLLDKPIIINKPNVFTPNGDNDNDIFYIETKFVKELELTILNRWGNVIFEQKNTNPVWNGTLKNGEIATDGVYFYRFTAVGINGDIIEDGGFLELFNK